MSKKNKGRTALGLKLEASLKEAVSHRRGEIALEGRIVEPMTPERIKQIRKKVSPVHPGAFLREDILPYVPMSKKDLADALGISRAQLYAILNESTPITAAMALRLGKLFGNGPDLWLNMQSRYDIETLGAKMKKELEAIPQVEAA